MAEGSGLLNRQRVKLLVGSNPTSSANTKMSTLLGAIFVRGGCVKQIILLHAGIRKTEACRLRQLSRGRENF